MSQNTQNFTSQPGNYAVQVRTNGTTVLVPSSGASRGTFTVPGATLGPGASQTYDTGIAVSSTAVVAATAEAGALSSFLTYQVVIEGGTIKSFIANTSSSTESFAAVTYNYVVL
jgi:hypothetical protein